MRELKVAIGGGDDDRPLVTMSGEVTEFASFSAVLERDDSAVVIDLGGVTHINSYGVREWIRFLQALELKKVGVELRRCSVPMVRQMTMLPAAAAGARLRSLMLPYYCETCDDERELLVELPIASIADEAPCPGCQGTMTFDDAPAAYEPVLKGGAGLS